MLQIAIGVGADELAPEMFICVDHGDHRGGDRCFRLDGQRVAALIAEFRVFLILLLALRAGFHPPENSTIKIPPGTEAWRLRLSSSVLISSCFRRQAYATFPYFTKGYVYYADGRAEAGRCTLPDADVYTSTTFDRARAWDESVRP